MFISKKTIKGLSRLADPLQRHFPIGGVHLHRSQKYCVAEASDGRTALRVRFLSRSSETDDPRVNTVLEKKACVEVSKLPSGKDNLVHIPEAGINGVAEIQGWDGRKNLTGVQHAATIPEPERYPDFDRVLTCKVDPVISVNYDLDLLINTLMALKEIGLEQPMREGNKLSPMVTLNIRPDGEMTTIEAFGAAGELIDGAICPMYNRK